MFANNGKWYKGNLHMHTTNSDGHLSPEAAMEVYRSAGYDFVAITDHWYQSEEVKKENFLVLSGTEIDSGDMINSPVYHIIGVGMDKKIPLRPDTNRNPQELIDAIREAGGIAILAHPTWSVTDPACVMELKNLSGVEIYNTISDIPFGNGARADASVYFDLWATKGFAYPAMAADDSHEYHGEQTTSYIMVNAKGLTKQDIFAAIAEGSFYASQGPEFVQIVKEGNKIRLECRGAKTAVFYSNCIWSEDRIKNVSGGSAEYKISKFDRYVRIELIDENGMRAWCTPIMVA